MYLKAGAITFRPEKLLRRSRERMRVSVHNPKAGLVNGSQDRKLYQPTMMRPDEKLCREMKIYLLVDASDW